MDFEGLKYFLHDLRHLSLIPRRYDAPRGMGEEYWRGVGRRYRNAEKEVSCSDCRLYVITYDDGRRELAYVRSLKGGLFSGMTSALYRGILIPRRIRTSTFSRVAGIEPAF